MIATITYQLHLIFCFEIHLFVYNVLWFGLFGYRGLLVEIPRELEGRGDRRRQAGFAKHACVACAVLCYLVFVYSLDWSNHILLSAGCPNRIRCMM